MLAINNKVQNINFKEKILRDLQLNKKYIVARSLAEIKFYWNRNKK